MKIEKLSYEIISKFLLINKETSKKIKNTKKYHFKNGGKKAYKMSIYCKNGAIFKKMGGIVKCFFGISNNFVFHSKNL